MFPYIFFSEKTDKGWGEPQNFGFPVNTTDDDLYFEYSPDGKRGYYTSALQTDGYGEKDPNAIIPLPKESVPDDMKLEPGMSLTLQNQDGQPLPVVVVEIKDDIIILDANHFLAGQELVFDIELVEIV